MQGTLKFNNYNMLLGVTDPMLKSLLPASSKRERNRFSANFSIRKYYDVIINTDLMSYFCFFGRNVSFHIDWKIKINNVADSIEV